MNKDNPKIELATKTVLYRINSYKYTQCDSLTIHYTSVQSYSSYTCILLYALYTYTYINIYMQYDSLTSDHAFILIRTCNFYNHYTHTPMYIYAETYRYA